MFRFQQVACTRCSPALAVAALLALAGCSNAPPVNEANAGRCDAVPVAWAVGQPADEDAMRRVWRESGSGLIRPVGPDQAMRRDRRDDRITVYIDRNNKITRLECR